MQFQHAHTRRAVLATGAATLLTARVALVTAGTAFSMTGAAWAADEPPARVDVAELMAPNALPDVVQGKADAPVTIVEYASMTCTHCAAFHAETYPTLQSKYIEPGKVKFILREFPLDALAAAAFMIARCMDDKRTAMVDLLFTQQRNWAFVPKPVDALEGIVKQAGLSSDAFKKCLDDRALYQKVLDVRQRASDKFQIASTPTFFVNGTRTTGEVSPDVLAKIIDPLLAAPPAK